MEGMSVGAGGADGRSGEESRPYLRQLIRDTHIAGQLFKAHSCITQPKVPVGSVSFHHPPGLEGRESERKVELREREVCIRVSVCAQVS